MSTSLAEQYPTLARFFRGYLHQDFAEDYPSAADALGEYRQQLRPRERKSLADECDRLSAHLADMSLARIRKVLSDDFGSAWHPAGRAEVLDLLRSS
jgi:hypothetical protein